MAACILVQFCLESACTSILKLYAVGDILCDLSTEIIGFKFVPAAL
jgi:hypothetical protein